MADEKIIENKYDFVASLGGSCSVASQLRRRNLRPGSFPLDWAGHIDKHSYVKLIESFEDNFVNWMNADYFVQLKEGEIDRGTKYRYRNLKTNFLFVHDFKKPATDEETLKEVQAKYKRRSDRLIKFIEEADRILFVSSMIFHSVTYEDVLPLKQYLEKRWPNKTFHFVIQQFSMNKNETLSENGITINNYTREENEYDHKQSNYEWAFLDDISPTEAYLLRKAKSCDKRAYKLWQKLNDSLLKYVEEHPDGKKMSLMTKLRYKLWKHMSKQLMAKKLLPPKDGDREKIIWTISRKEHQ